MSTSPAKKAIQSHALEQNSIFTSSIAPKSQTCFLPLWSHCLQTNNQKHMTRHLDVNDSVSYNL